MTKLGSSKLIFDKPPSRSQYDAVVIGAGHNGLVTAAYLARNGLSVLVVERRSVLGGAAATEEVFPGFEVNTGSGDVGLFLPQIVVDLKLENSGLEFLESPVVALSLNPDGPSLTLWRDRKKSANEIARISKPDAQKYLAFLGQLDRFTPVLDSVRTKTPPSVPKYNYAEILQCLRVAIDLKRLGDQEMMEFMRLLPMPVSEFLDEWFENPLLKAALSFSGVMGSMQGPRAAGTTFMFLYHAMGAGEAGFRASRFVRGGTGRLSESIAGFARQNGAEICTGVDVSQIILDGEKAQGIILEHGEQISSQVIVSCADPRHTFFDLVGPSHLEVRFVREAKNIKFRGSTARVNLALSGLPDFTGLARKDAASDLRPLLSGHILICPDMETLERAYDDAKYGRFSQNPCLDIVIPTIMDPSLAPAGKHLMSIDVRYAPYHLKEGTWEIQRDALADRALEILALYAPNIKDLILNQQTITPWDLEKVYSLPEGSIYHSQMGLDQLLFMRPVAGYGRYRTPINNLYLCGVGTHPGGGVTGAPGYNAAGEILRDLK